MKRKFVALVLFVSMSCCFGCDRIQKELETRHLSGGHKSEVLKNVRNTIQKGVEEV